MQQLLKGPAPDGGEWTNRQVAEWLQNRLGRPVYPQLASAYRRRLSRESFS